MRSLFLVSFLLFSLVFLSSPVFSQPASNSILSILSPNDGKPKEPTEDRSLFSMIDFDHLYYDAGFLQPGVSQVVHFAFRNSGGLPLTLNQVQCTCPNVQVVVPKASFDADQQGKIKATITPTSQGDILCTFVVQSNARNDVQLFQFKGIVK